MSDGRNGKEVAGQPGDEWVLGVWHCYFGMTFLGVSDKGGRPWVDAHPAAAHSQWYRWHSYHSVRKFQREHPALEGYTILNLSKVLRQWERQRSF